MGKESRTSLGRPVEEFDLLAFVFRRYGRGGHGRWAIHYEKASIVGGEMLTSTSREPLSPKKMCEDAVSQVFSVAVNGSINWRWSHSKSETMRIKGYGDDLSHEDEQRRKLGDLLDKDV